MIAIASAGDIKSVEKAIAKTGGKNYQY